MSSGCVRSVFGTEKETGLKTLVFKPVSGAEGEIRTLARFLDDYSLSRGAPSASWVLPQVDGKIQLAERVGFEPTDAFTSPVFKTGAFNRSAISPDNEFTSNSQTQE